MTPRRLCCWAPPLLVLLCSIDVADKNKPPIAIWKEQTMIASLASLIAANPWIATLGSLVVGYLLKHYGIGPGLLTGQPAAPLSVPVSPAVPAVGPIVDAVHSVTQMLIDHPEIKDELLKALATLAAKAGGKA